MRKRLLFGIAYAIVWFVRLVLAISVGMALSASGAVTLGTDLHRWRILYLIVTALMVGFAVYTTGIIGFVGLIIPHVVRMMFGTDHKKLIPISALLGAIFLLWADVLCRGILARALAQQTPCLILDEPTNHLDIKYQLQLMDLVRGLDRTIITAVHDLNIAAMYCDRLYALKDRQIVGQGMPQELLTPEFIRAVYEVDAEVYRDKRGILRLLYFPDCVKAEEIP